MYRVEEKLEEPKFGSRYAAPKGAVANRGASTFAHRFGGASWRIKDSAPISEGPTLLLTLDISDSLFAHLPTLPAEEIPICSYLTRDVWVMPQFYRIEPRRKQVICEAKGTPATEAHFPELENPLPETSLDLLPMMESDYPTTEKLYWQACDDFLGGDRFIRVLGPPLWTYSVAKVYCQCADEMIYLCSIGYEGRRTYSHLLGDQPVFFGEAALYWFVCVSCLTVGVISQPT
jgi:hypothetical protein